MAENRQNLIFRQARVNEIPVVQDAYRGIREHLAATVDFPHWHSENHPRPELIARWVKAGDLYVAMISDDDPSDEQMAGVVVLDHEPAEDYRSARWAIDARDDQILIIHVLGVLPAYQGTGIARFLVDSAIETARQRGCLAVRLDVTEDNEPAHRLYSTCGFADLGLHTLRRRETQLDQFHLYEYVV